MRIEIISNKEEDTINIGKNLAKFLRPGDLILLYGDLGCGKTTFVKGLAEGLEVDPDIYITSPTFSLINIYEGKYTIYHVDLYRLEEFEIEELGIWEYLNSGIVIIEWADKLSGISIENFLEIKFEYFDFDKRKITLIGYGEWQNILKEWKKSLNLIYK